MILAFSLFFIWFVLTLWDRSYFNFIGNDALNLNLIFLPFTKFLFVKVSYI